MIIPEIIIQKAIVSGRQALQRDPRLIDILFKNTSKPMREAIKDIVLNRTIDFSVNYPRKQLTLPAIVLLLRSESEAETFLGDHIGTSPFMGVPDQDSLYDTEDGHGGSVSVLEGLPEAILQGITVEASSGSLVTIADASTEAFQEIAYPEMVNGGSYVLYVVAGTGVGQTRIITGISNITIDTEADFAIDLDSTSVVDIRRELLISEEGEPSRVYSQNGTYERFGVHYDTQYQLQIMSGHQEEVIYLYSIIKALLLMQRPYLEGQGMMVFKLSGSDFAPRGDYLPSEAFMRVMNIQFTYPFTFLQELNVPTSIQVNLIPDELGFPNSGVPINIANFNLT